MNEMTQEQRDVAARVAKILRLADRNPNANEAAAAAAKAQQMLEDYNLTASQVELASGDTGARAQEMVRGGHYEYQRDLWRAVAELNFCLYMPRQVLRRRKDGSLPRRKSEWGGDVEVYGYVWQHNLVGRIVNVAAATVMAQYLEGAVERLLRERLSARGQDHKFYFSNWSLSYREGAFNDIIRRLYERRRQKLADDLAERDRAAAAAGASTATALTLADVAEREHDANMDYLHGEGYSARQRAERAARAQRQKEAEEEHARWAAANPEEAAAQEEERRKEDERYWARRRGGRQSSTMSGRQTDYGAYNAGARAGAGVSIDQQAGHGAANAPRLR